MDINATEVVTKVTTNLIEDAIKGAWSKTKKWFKDLDSKDAIRYGTAYEEYLDNTYRKYSKIKTIIYRRVPKDLYSFYECIGLSYNGKTINTCDINNILNTGKKIILTGSGGMGKSILLKHLYLNSIETTGNIPVLLELRSFNAIETKDICLEETIYQVLVQNGFTLEKEYFEYSMLEGGYIILLDGFDELNRDKAAKVSAEIKKLADKYGENYYILSSRPSEEFIGWNDFYEAQTMPLNKTQAINLINKIDFDENIKTIFCRELEETLFEKYESFAQNPLLLNIMLLTFNNHASIPDKLNDFYDQAFATLFNMHDATKDAYVRDIRTQLGCEDFKLIFAYICFKSYFKSEYEFTETKLREHISEAKNKFKQFKFTVDEFLEDLTLSVCMLVKDGLNYHFSHRSFQEYFAAWYTCKLTDEIQKKLLSSWLKESLSSLNDSYFTMLYNMQPEKVNKIILFPGLRKIQTLYTEKGFSIEFLSKLFTGLSTRVYFEEENGKKVRYKSISLNIKDNYMCSVLKLSCILNGYSFPKINTEAEEKVYDLIKKNSKTGKIVKPFKEVLDFIDEADLLEALKWFEKQIEFSIFILEQEKENDISKKKRVSSILDEL
ncbi:MAG: NACHT domain-containing protein [Clostridia bacterium]|nr:NACHT domain-containing protein [Clostridia bacterium]